MLTELLRQVPFQHSPLVAVHVGHGAQGQVDGQGVPIVCGIKS